MNGNEANNVFVCLNCGTKLNERQEFCHKCGMKKGEYNKILCKHCSTELQLNEKFCPKCGAKSEKNIGINEIVNTVKKECKTKANKISLKKIIIILIIIAVLIVLFCIGKNIISKLNVSIEDLLANGQYLEAYERAKEDEKSDIITENILAVLSIEISENLKNPSSFKLTTAWFDRDNQKIVMNVSGTNSYGGVVSSYYYYMYDSEENKYELYTSLSELTAEEYAKYDSSSENLEKILKNAAREVVKNIINNNDYKVSSKTINNINQLFKDGKLNEVTLIDGGDTI